MNVVAEYKTRKGHFVNSLQIAVYQSVSSAIREFTNWNGSREVYVELRRLNQWKSPRDHYDEPIIATLRWENGKVVKMKGEDLP